MNSETSLNHADDIRRQNEFDDRLELIRQEGAQAFADGLGRDACPYLDHPEPHYSTTWIGGWAEASLFGDDHPLKPS